MHWISVKERYPEKDDEYLVITKDLRNECFCLHVWTIIDTKNKKMGWKRCLQHSYDHPYECGEVTHWIEIPPAPTKSNECKGKCLLCTARKEHKDI